MQYALALLFAGAVALPAALAQDTAPPQEEKQQLVPVFDAQPLCHDGQLVGLLIYSNVPIAMRLTWDPKVCAQRDS